MLQYMGRTFGEGYYESAVQQYKWWANLWSLRDLADALTNDIMEGRGPMNAVFPEDTANSKNFQLVDASYKIYC